MDNEILRELQNVELEILLDVDRVCKENNIEYFLVAGTLLGAVRHKGFIPWDDDIDICMPIKDYKKFCKIAPHKLKKEYFLQCSNTDFTEMWFAKVRKNNTTCIESGEEKKRKHQGVWIDIFPLIGVKNDKMWLDKATQKATLAKTLLKKRYSSFGSFKDLPLKKKILKMIPLKIVRMIANAIFNSVFKDHRKFEYCYYLWGSPRIKSTFKSYLFDELSCVEFEGHNLPAPKRWDEYLQVEYGDYMTPPPPENRNGGSHTISIVDLNKDYTHYRFK